MSPDPFPARAWWGLGTRLKSGRRAWYRYTVRNYVTEREGPEHIVGPRSSDLQLANSKRHGYIATIRVKCDPSKAQSLGFQLIEGTVRVKQLGLFKLD